MGIKALYNKKDLEKSLDKQAESLKNNVTNTFFEAGKKAVDLAVSDGNYINRTGVLRSSIGCGISFGGVILKTYGFNLILSGGEKGASEGKRLLLEKLKTNVTTQSIKLVVVAGADYASFVEDSSRFSVLPKSADLLSQVYQEIVSSLKIK